MSKNSSRNLPRQPRSQQTVDLILETAAKLFVDIGYANSTTNAIAERANLSIGSLYRYFPDKEAVLQALAERFSLESQKILQNIFVEDARYLPSQVLIDRLLDPYLELYRQYPVYAHILLGSDVSFEIATAARQQESVFIGQLAAFFQGLAPNLEPERAHRAATLCKGISKMLISLVITSNDEQYQQEITAEVKQILVNYLRPILRPNES